MPRITFEGQALLCAEQEDVLQCLLRHNVPITYSCRSGACQSCLVRVVDGEMPPKAQAGLRDTLKADRYALACQCVPTTDVEIARPALEGMITNASVVELERLNDRIMRVRAQPATACSYRAGQFFNILHDGTARSYSAASVPDAEGFIEFHVARIDGGFVSGWVHDRLRHGDAITLMGPQGHCFYTPGDRSQPLLLAGTGTGLAPLYGIARDALRQRHEGPIHLFHGALQPSGLYLADALQSLDRDHAQFHYHPCVLRGTGPPGCTTGPLDEVVMARHGALRGWRIYVCGHPDMVRLLQRKAFMAGASMKAIYADAFLPSAVA